MGIRARIRRRRGERGASLVEFALLLPLLLLVLLGITEFGWTVAQQIDVRHKAREGLRQVVVAAPEADVVAKICADDIVKGSDIDSFTIVVGADEGDPATLTVIANIKQITGFFSWLFGSTPQITSMVEGRVEQTGVTYIATSCP